MLLPKHAKADRFFSTCNNILKKKKIRIASLESTAISNLVLSIVLKSQPVPTLFFQIFFTIKYYIGAFYFTEISTNTNKLLNMLEILAKSW